MTDRQIYSRAVLVWSAQVSLVKTAVITAVRCEDRSLYC